MTSSSLPVPQAAGGPRRLVVRLRRAVASLPVPSERMVRVGLVAAVGLVAMLTITPWPVGAFQDDAMYTVLAKSLAEGHGYRFLNLPGEPNATHFPPGYPLLLAGLWALWPRFPDNIVLFKFANAVLLAAAAFGAFAWTRRRFAAPVPAAALVALVGTLSIVVLVVTGVVMSEPLFLALLFPALLRTERAAETGALRDAAVAGALLGALALVRTLGAVAVPAAMLVLAGRRHWKGALVLGAVGAAVLGPWQWWVGVHQGEVAPVLAGKFGSYGPWLVDGYRDGGVEFARGVVRRNAAELWAMLGYYFMPVARAWPRSVTLAAVLAFAVLGTKRFGRNAPVSLAFLGLYSLVVMLWPFEPARFLLAVWPLLPVLVGCGVVAAWQVAGGTPVALGGRLVVGALVVAFVAGSGWYNAVGYSRRWWASTQREAGERAKPIVEWAARYTRPGDVLSTEDDLIVYLYAGRQSVPTATFTPGQRLRTLSDAEDLATVRQLFDAYHPSFFVVGSQQGIRTATALMAGPTPRLRYMGRIPGMQIYQSTAR